MENTMNNHDPKFFPRLVERRTESAVNDNDPEFSRDLIRGAEGLAEFLFGDRKFRRRVYHLASSSALPVFKLGSMLCARRSSLLRYVADQEARRTDDDHKHA
jgi:hypothetical protein